MSDMDSIKLLVWQIKVGILILVIFLNEPSSSSVEDDSLSDYMLLSEDDLHGPPPVISANLSPNVTVSVGRRAVLKCRVQNKARRTVSWVRHSGSSQSPSLLTVGKFVFSQDRRVEVLEEPALNNWVLVIDSAVAGDSGGYECQINTVPHTGHILYLQVVEPTSVIEGKTEVYVNLGSPHSILCKVTSPEPPDHIFWYFQKQPLAFSPSHSVSVSLSSGESVSELNLLDAKMGDTGLYECRPSNTRPANISLVVLDGELPAAMQTSSGRKLTWGLLPGDCYLGLVWGLLLVLPAFALLINLQATRQFK